MIPDDNDEQFNRALAALHAYNPNARHDGEDPSESAASSVTGTELVATLEPLLIVISSSESHRRRFVAALQALDAQQ